MCQPLLKPQKQLPVAPDSQSMGRQRMTLEHPFGDTRFLFPATRIWPVIDPRFPLRTLFSNVDVLICDLGLPQT